VRYALVVGLNARSDDATKAYHAFKWLTQAATPEWVQLCAMDLFRLLRQRGQMRAFKKLIGQDAQVQAWVGEYQIMMDAPADVARLEQFVTA